MIKSMFPGHGSWSTESFLQLNTGYVWTLCLINMYLTSTLLSKPGLDQSNKTNYAIDDSENVAILVIRKNGRYYDNIIIT